MQRTQRMSVQSSQLRRTTALALGLLLQLALLLAGQSIVAQETAASAIIPRPVKMTPGTGTFTIDASTIVVAGQGAKAEAETLAQFLEPALGRRLKLLKSGQAQDGAIALLLAEPREPLGDEGYRLEVSPRRVVLRAAKPAGLFYGVQTLRQLLPPAVYGPKPAGAATWSLPCVQIVDYPRFAWRGLLLDPARHFMPKEYVKKLIDVMAAHKLNTLQLHLTDDQGWRIEIKKYPKLTEVGAWREETLVGRLNEKPWRFDGKRHGGFYSQADIRELVAFAAQRHVNLVPEIEMPGHAGAAITAYPELSCFPDRPKRVWTRWGISPDIFSPNERTVGFLQDVLKEVMEMFPSRFIHVGGDEAIKDYWKESKEVQRRIKDLGLKDEEELQSWFIRRMDAFLTRSGRRLVGWDEILQGGLAPGATVMSWRGQEGGIAAARSGHDVIMTPTSHTYFDYYQGPADREPLAIGGMLPLDKVYSFDPIPAALSADQGRRVLGSQGQLWSEYIPTPRQAEYMTWPRATALAEVLWTPPAGKDYADFSCRLRLHQQRLDALEVAYRPLDPPVGQESRRTISLDGTWQIAEGSLDQVPREFKRQAPVPGLADMAKPTFEAVGTEESSKHRQAFWYRRTFTLEGKIPEAARLKIHKAAFGARVFLNGKLVGDHAPCFTPVEFDVRKDLKGPGEANELVVRVGAHRNVLPKGLPDGFDFEKIRYIPGIYDSVELLLSGLPRIARVQTVPDLEGQAVRAVIQIEGAEANRAAKVLCRVREAATGKLAGTTEVPMPRAEGQRSADVRIPIAGCHLWSPEDPFLYELEVSTGQDALRTRFGMRTFRFDQATGKALLNGKPYLMRGTNVCVYRFFEDPERGDRPWREEWVRRLHRVFKSMHWNSIRYCIGFPPELWYRIADEEGLLIQDEFPIWYGGDRWPKELKSDELVKEYTEWMQERWNHPCVVIWDAQNETVGPETGKAIQAVRGLDLSGRPWDNGWSPPQAPTDVYEAHPYAHSNPAFRLSSFAKFGGSPGFQGTPSGNVFPNAGKNPVIINEYGWLWLNRDGSPTTLSKGVYERLLGPGATADQRRELYARLLGAKTEFWRCRRQVAGVLHFCGLGYSRQGGQTSDHFVDIEKLTLEPNFQRYVGDAFAPVGLMIDYWDDDPPPGRAQAIPVVVINDLYTSWSGSVRLRLMREKQIVTESSQPCTVAGLGSRTLTFDFLLPEQTGRYQLIAELSGEGGRPVRSLRDFALLTAAERAARDGIAVGKPVTASSSLNKDGATSPAAAVDGDPGTRWSSEFSDPQWIAVDLGRPTKISRVELLWEAAHGKAYAIQVSLDGKTWKDVFTTENGRGTSETIRFAPTEARWVRMHGTKRATEFGYSLWEFRIFP